MANKFRNILFSILFLIFILPNNCFSEEINKRFFQGAINNKFKIQMEFYIVGTEDAFGQYFYESKKINIKLRGVINIDQNIFALREFNETDEQTGLFKGKFITNSRIEGEWSTTDGTKKMPFYLEEMKIPDYINLSGDWSSSGIDNIEFSITLYQACTNIYGYHNGMTNDASRIDAVIEEDGLGPSIIPS